MRKRWFVGSFLAAIVIASPDLAIAQRPPGIAERLRGADQAIVATAADVMPTWQQNTHGDQLIVSQVLLKVEETLKGVPEDAVRIELEGGTLGGLTLHVSDLPEIKAGDRAVFFLDRHGASRVPHLRGLGVLKLDSDNRVSGSSLHLDEIRQIARTAR